MKRIITTFALILLTAFASSASKGNGTENNNQSPFSIRNYADTTRIEKIIDDSKKKEEKNFIDVMRTLLLRFE